MMNAVLAFKLSIANLAPTVPWNGSMKQARKVKGLVLPSILVVTCTFVEVGLICTTFFSLAISEIGMDALEHTSPTMYFALTVGYIGFDLLAQHAALRVPLINGHQGAIAGRDTEGRLAAAQRRQNG